MLFALQILDGLPLPPQGLGGLFQVGLLVTFHDLRQGAKKFGHILLGLSERRRRQTNNGGWLGPHSLISSFLMPLRTNQTLKLSTRLQHDLSLWPITIGCGVKIHIKFRSTVFL